MDKSIVRTIAVIFSLLILTSTAAGPVVASLNANPATTGESVEIDRSLAPVEQKQRALALTGNLEPAPGKQEAAARKARQRLRNSTGAISYRDPVRLKSVEAFERDAQAVQSLSAFSKTNSEQTAHRISKLVLAADNESAAQAIADAKAALEARKGSMSRGERRRAEAHIRNAERAFERSEAPFGAAKSGHGTGGNQGNGAKRNGAKPDLRGKDADVASQNPTPKDEVTPVTENGTTETATPETNSSTATGTATESATPPTTATQTETPTETPRQTSTQSPTSTATDSPTRTATEPSRTTDATHTETSRSRARGNGPRGAKAFHARAKAIVHLKMAWKHADLALRSIDRATEPRITIESRIDPVWQDGEPGTYYVTGRVSELRPDTIGNVTVSVGNQSVNATTVRDYESTPPSKIFWAEVDRDTRVATITVRVEESDTRDVGTETLQLDGDGLPASFEREIGADPQDPDSEIAALAGDQAGDGVHDGAAVARSDALGARLAESNLTRPSPVVVGNDSDGDGLSDFRERQIGTNASSNDTDGDGVTDLYETNGGARVDTDGDGRLDVHDADADGDGVVDARELRNDTDADLLANYRDLDDDGDGIPTATEVANGSTYAHDVDFDDEVNWLDTDADDDGVSDGEEGLADHDGDGMPAYLDNDRDNDGLPGSYERKVTGTDPANNDSDYTGTAHDEAGNDVIDGMEDVDGDTIGAYREYKHGTDPFDADTDGDGLPDGFEIRRTGLDPTAADTDGDGVPDGAADPDRDGLDNLAEYNATTAFDKNDTDADGIDDGRELELGTDPLAADTDGDGLPDAEERSLPTNATLPDTDGDGVLDGNETFETTARNESLGATVSLTGHGDVAGKTTIKNGSTTALSTDAITDARVSPIVDFESDAEFESANVTLEYDQAAVDETNESLVVARFNRTTQTFDLLNSTTDVGDGTVTAETPHFSRFTVFNVANWESSFTAEEPGSNESTGEDPSIRPVDVVYVMDSSGSMGSNDPDGFRKIAAKRFTGALLDGDRASVVDFDSNAQVTQSLTRNFAAVNNSVDRLDATGGTNIGNGVATANTHLARESNDSRAKVQVLLTDGYGSGGIQEARTAAERNTTIHTIGLVSADTEKLKRIANITGGTFHQVQSASDLPEVFSRVADNTTNEATDTDGDGLPDHVERGFKTGYGETLSTDPEDPDTDGDGIPDGQEVGERVNATQQVTVADGVTKAVEVTYRRISSDPTSTDTDGDSLSDAEERNGWNASLATDPEQADAYLDAVKEQDPEAESELSHPTVTSNPLYSDTDLDGLSDSLEKSQGLNPNATDSDGDGTADDVEFASGTDPTLHDHTAPTVTVRSIDNPDVARTVYEVTFRVRDESGIRRVSFHKKGSEQYSLTGDGAEEIGFETIEFKVERDTVDKILTGTASFFTASSVTVETTDVHGTSNTITAQGADTFGQAAEIVANSPVLPHDLGKREIVLLMSFASGVTTNIGEAILGLADLVTNLKQYLESMYEMAAYVATHLEVLLKLPGMMVDQVAELREQRNPFQNVEGKVLGDPHDTWNVGWSVGYLAGTAIQFAVGTGAAAAVKRVATTSSRLAPIIKAMSGVKNAGKLAVSTRAMRAAGTVRKAMPDVDLNERALLQRLDEMSAPTRARTAKAMSELSDGTKSYLDETSVAHPGTKTATLIRYSGSTGRKALDALATGNRKAANALLRAADDVLTHRAMLRAWSNGDIDTDELASALRKYDDIDASQRSAYRSMIRSTGGDGAYFAARADSDTLDSVLSIGCGGSVLPSVGAASGVGSGPQFAVRGLTPAALGASGSCLPSPEAEKFKAGIARASTSDEVDSFDEIEDAVDTVENLDGDSQTAAARLIGDNAGDGVTVTNDVSELPDKVDGLNEDEVGKLLQSYDTYNDDPAATRDVREVQDDINRLADEDELTGLDDSIEHASDGGLGNIKGLDGEVETVNRLLDNGVPAKDITMEKDVKLDEDDIQAAKEAGLDPDADLHQKTDIDADVADGTAYEVKNRDYKPFTDLDFAYDEVASDINELRMKLNTVAASGEDEITVVVRRDADAPFSSDVQERLPDKLDDVENLEDLGNRIEANFDGVEVTFKRFNEVDG